ncbi:Tautomerase/MIF superfamily [Aspergillus ambiguus]|uniref:MIF domain protein n=1 Tax=Aspergillus ambiguus TaxID=176160 RepID=UPI003CCDB251
MTTRRNRVDFSLRRHDYSSSSSTGLVPAIPVLESPVTFRALTRPDPVTESDLKKKIQVERDFVDEREDADDVSRQLLKSFPPDGTSSRITPREIEKEPLYRSKSQYFEDAFNIRGFHMSPRTRLSETSIVVVEVKLSTKVKDGYSLASTIASQMARIYQKPQSSMMVNIQHSACLHFGNPKHPSYLMKISALLYMIAPISNLRSATLIQAAMQQLLHITPDCGVVLYFPIPEENFATDGATMSSEITRLERRSEDEDPGILRTISRSMSRRLKSSSVSSAPVSEATTVSHSCESEPTASKDMESPCDTDVLKDETSTTSVKKPRSIRRLLPRGHSIHQRSTEDQK